MGEVVRYLQAEMKQSVFCTAFSSDGTRARRNVVCRVTASNGGSSVRYPYFLSVH